MINRTLKVFLVISIIVFAFFFIFNYYLPSKIDAKAPGLSYWKSRQSAVSKTGKIEQNKNSIAPSLGVANPKSITYEAFNPNNVKKQKDKKNNQFAVPKLIETEFNFWFDVYTKYDKGKVVFHDKKYLDIIYSVIDVSDVVYNEKFPPAERIRRKKERVNTEMNRIASILRSLDNKNPTSLTPEEEKIYHLFDNIHEPKKFHRAARRDRLRSQTGIKEKFIRGIGIAGRYLGEMEKIFAGYKVPLEITRLAFVESMFNLEALSKVGASGIWQFMPSSGRLFGLKNDQFVDERNDPIIATHAAAKHLKRDYEMLGTWPLAINAYNTGPGRMRRAVRTMGTTNIAKIIKNFESRGYKFASRNFFPAFLAALHAFENRNKYFGVIEMEKPLEFDLLETPFFTTLPELSKYTGISLEKLALLNPHLESEVINGKLPVPQRFSLRVPKDQGENVLIAMNEMNSLAKYAKWHIVSPGENLKTIAAKYNTDEKKIKRANGIGRNAIKAGQILKLPKGIELAKEVGITNNN